VRFSAKCASKSQILLNFVKKSQKTPEKELEIERVTKLKAKLEAALSVDLGPRAPFWNSGLTSSQYISYYWPLLVPERDCECNRKR
jgi:hypothetical protein